MRKFLSLLFGLGLGALIGALLVTFFSPLSGAEFRENWRAHYQQALAAGRAASAERRAELEAELEELRQEG